MTLDLDSIAQALRSCYGPYWLVLMIVITIIVSILVRDE